ncbi:solute carrier family 39 (zinc transporter), member 7 [Cryptococcus deuterogattii 99/473]|uniref:Solute carrier family 39 (Zinc transporter), member 7 n=1 Tax=Cryptococcus deuterogattii Ram5 TaxID=1296110 RepID=A0A0D0V9X1_9TREE|nr:solute carrier family 39 (zinc transporter), member 7 [Cryptococcus deuterogattii MMRL2647]KIR43249.1 solute carrier family 39 (zinc transporter), member 7 [Cryptococcus deuterogattii Ram5]KIR74582.1 solute carrier family 39 (zinc transporter), member 7 [Cryptococcus deuterogattii CA1014]KIY56933.1 solute carrier family 39 (zinc transporter), member 7 [Cryptococcus deuterogattii 99/473]
MLSSRPVAILSALTLGAVVLAGAYADKNQNFFGAPTKQVEGTSMKKVFATLFPFESPAWNSILATFYISSIPNFILLAVPASLDLTSLNTMISFATGGLLGDVFLHLVPHAFFGEGHEVGRSLVVEEKRNITMRVLSSSAGGEGNHHHSHSHSHSHTHVSSGRSSSIETEKENELRQRKTPITDSASADSKAVSASQDEKAVKETNPSLKLSAYLNLFGDFTHNITDGLAMAASFYSSPALGAVTTIATFCHEIPHETCKMATKIADYSILIKSGFTKSQAMGSQFFTAVGAFVGTFLGIWIAETSGAGNASAHGEGIRLNIGEGLFGTSVAGGELVIPMTAGGFLYIASVSVIPELLEESRSGKQALKEYAAMAFGVFCMGVIAWNE